MSKIQELRPYYVSKIWGGSRLAKLKGIENKNVLPLGESWEVSLLQEGTSFLLSGEKLTELVNDTDIPYLVKFIDTTDYLSIQVHPNDDYAAKFEGSTGKTECWVILEADLGEGIYLGLKKGVTKKEFKDSVLKKARVDDLLNFFPVKKGDFFFVPAGTVHAIGKGVTLAEVQQSSGVTYRVWDWNRLGLDGKPRDLHIKKALDVINFGEEFNSVDFFNKQENIFNQKNRELVKHKDFKLEVICLDTEEEFIVKKAEKNRKRALIILSGEISIENEKLYPYKSYLLWTDELVKIQGGSLLNHSTCLLIS